MREELIARANDSETSIKALREWHKLYCEEMETKRKEEIGAIQAQIALLENGIKAINKRNYDQADEVKADLDQKVAALSDHVRAKQRVVDLLRIRKKLQWDTITTDFTVEERVDYGKYEKVEPFEVILDNPYIRVGAFVFKNARPVNKYSLAVFGRSVFGSVMKYPNGYVRDGHESGANIQVELPAFDSEEKAKLYWSRNKRKALAWLDDHEAVEEEFKPFEQGCYDTAPWLRLALGQERKYLEAIGYTDTHEYKRIMAELEDLA